MLEARYTLVLILLLFSYLHTSKALIEDFDNGEPRDSWFSLPSFLQDSASGVGSGGPAPKFKPCDPVHENGDMTNVTVTPCEGEGDCPLVRGTNVTLDFEFSSRIKAKSLWLRLSGVFGWFVAPFESAENMCNEGIECPAKVGGNYKYRKTFFIRPNFPTVSLDVRVKVTDDRRNEIACALIPVEIK